MDGFFPASRRRVPTPACILLAVIAIAVGAPHTRATPRPSTPAFWSYLPVHNPALPTTRNTHWPRSTIDRFILARLESEGLKPVPDADRITLLRRLSFDLVGLPPSPADLADYLADTSPRATERVVDRLLASPEFGAKWARHWLDAARYAESTGKERNHTFPEAWRYRDYVVRALNADLPYDRFVREQIAGDLLPASSDTDRAWKITATGFLALGPKGLNERRTRQFIADVIDEQIDVTFRTIMGATVACARCHDHKSEPIPQEDYTAVAGILLSTETCYGTSGIAPLNRHPSPLLSLPIPPDTRSPGAAEARAMGAREGRPANARVLQRGEINQPGKTVPRGFPKAFPITNPPVIPAGTSGRLEWADWLTRPDNPRTARVQVNRVWLHLFGSGLVPTPDDFGRTGEPPTHPELLDDLARRFMATGWSLKSLIREMVLSRTYQLSSAPDPAALQLDPDNHLRWRMSPRRLEAESIRDGMLAASGLLDLTPPGPSPIADVGDLLVPRLRGRDLTARVAHRRSIYLPVLRDRGIPALDLFDFPDPSLPASERESTSVGTQALYLMNDPFVLEQSRALARRLLDSDAGTDPDRIRRAYEWTLARPPQPAEVTRALAYLRSVDATALVPAARRGFDSRTTAWTLLAQALFASAEFRYLR